MGEWTRVGNISRLTPNEPKCLTLKGRQVTIVMTADRRVRCFDSFCFHFGGQLGKHGVVSLVDIEDLGTHPIIRCPDHGKEISLIDGRVLEKTLEGRVEAGDQVQRVHQVQVQEGGDVHVLLSLEGKMASDKYAATPVADPANTMGQRTLQSAGLRVRKAMGAAGSRASKVAKSAPQRPGTQLTLPGLFANAPPAEPTSTLKKLQFVNGTQMTMPQAIRQIEASRAEAEQDLAMDLDD